MHAKRTTQKVVAFSLSMLIGLTPGMLYTSAFALPQGGQSIAGNVQFVRDGNRMVISTSAQRSIAEYLKFDIGQNEYVHFNLPGSGAAILNRVTGGNPSSILGQMTGNGQIFLVNPAGVFFGPTSTVNVGSLFTSTLDIKNQDFLSGNLTWFQDPNRAPGGILNEGTINVAPGGFIALTGGAVENRGSLNAPGGAIHLAVGDRLSAAISDTTLVEVTVDEALKSKVEDFYSAVANHGDITADGGLVKMQANLVSNLYQYAVNNTGRVRSRSVQEVNGEIVLLGQADDQQALVSHTGVIDVSGRNAGETGGTVHILGDEVTLEGDAQVDASGDRGGGEILIGGNYQGGGDTHRAVRTTVEKNVQLLANAETDGDGGKIVAWADDYTHFDALAEVKAGQEGGNGGLVETSGKQTLSLGENARINASASNGKGGLWLLDPLDFTLNNANVAAIQGTLDTGTDVTITTNVPGVDVGNITVEDGVSILKTAGNEATLRLEADNSILFEGTGGGGITFASTSDKLHVELDSVGAISLAHTTINSNGGNITLGSFANGTNTHVAGVSLDNTVLNAGAGNITLRGRGWNNAASSNLYGVVLGGASQLLTTTGDILVHGEGGTGQSDNYGVYLNGNNTRISTTDGDITVTGKGSGATGVNIGVYLNSGGQILSGGNGTVTVNGTGGDGTFQNDGVRINGNNALISSLNGAMTIIAQGGDGSGSTNRGLALLSGGQITSTGNATLQINASAGAGSNNNQGLLVQNNNSRISSVNGDVTIVAQGNSGTGNDSNNYGVYLFNGGQILSTGTAKLDITGTGGNASSNNHGVFVSGNNALISSANGAIDVKGTGKGSSNTNVGVYVSSGGKITGTAAGQVSVTGQGSATGTNNNHGVYVTDANSQISGVNGAITVSGTGNGSGSNNYGVFLLSGGQVNSTGTGVLSVTGQGGNGTDNNAGVHVNGNDSQISSTGANITVTGTGQGSGNDNSGVRVLNAGKIAGAGAAQVNVTGQGSATGANYNSGVYVAGANSLITGEDGAITLNGTGNGSGGFNVGVHLESGGQVTSTGVGVLSVTGQGGNGTFGNTGVFIYNNSQISSAGADITVNGTGKGSNIDNYGVYIANASKIAGAGAAQVNVTGQGSATGANANHGVFVTDADSEITGVNGAITVSGTGNGSGVVNYGVFLLSGGQVTSKGSGVLSVTGQGGNGTDSNVGVVVSGPNSEISSTGADITVNGTGKGSGGNNYGVSVEDAGKIAGAGAAQVNVTGQGSATGTNANYGVYVTGADSEITGVNGAVTVSGTGNGSDINNYGVSLWNGGQVTSTGTGVLSVTGQGGDGTNSNFGVFVSGNDSQITSAGASITVEGTGRGNGINNHGVAITSAGKVAGTATAEVNVTGQGSAAGTNTNYGVLIENANSLITGVNGNITVEGTGGGLGDNNHGISLLNNSAITGTGTGNLTLRGSQGVGGNSVGLQTQNGLNILGANNMIGDLSILVDKASLANLQLRTQGDLTISPITNTTSIGIQGAAGTLQLGDVLDMVDGSPNRVVIGNATAGTGAVTIGDGWDFSLANSPVEVHGGSITADSITTGTNALLMVARTGNAVMNGVINSDAAGDAVTIAASNGDFINNAGAGLFNLTVPGSRWLVYSKDTATIQKGGLAGGFGQAIGYVFGDNIGAFAGKYIFYAQGSLLSPAPLSKLLLSREQPAFGMGPILATSIAGGVLLGAPVAARILGAASSTQTGAPAPVDPAEKQPLIEDLREEKNAEPNQPVNEAFAETLAPLVE